MENLNYGTYDFLIVDKLGCEEMVSIDIHAAELLAPVIHATNDHGIIDSDSIYETIPFDVEFSFTVNDEDMVEGWLWRIGTVHRNHCPAILNSVLKSKVSMRYP
jgi:hypothetical protein